VKLNTTFLEWSTVELRSIVYEECMGYPEPHMIDLHKKVFHTSGSDGYKCFCFGPFGEVVNSRMRNFLLPFPEGIGPMRSMPHSANGHGEEMGINLSGDFLGLGQTFDIYHNT
jgi:hypothetical protein